METSKSVSSPRQLRVLWATDGSAAAHNAVPFLQQLILPVTRQLVVLTVAHHSLAAGVSAAARHQAVAEATRIARGEAALVDTADVATTAARWGHPVEEIIKASRSPSADLIVLGAKGHSDLALLLLGSVAQGVVHHSTRPVLIARPGPLDLRRIVLGYDGTPPARRAVAFLERLAPSPAIEIVVAHVIEPLAVPSGMPPGYRAEAMREAHRVNEQRHQRAERGLRAVTEQLAAAGHAARSEIVVGPAVGELDALVRNLGADLLVVGSRKPSPDEHYLLGTTAEKLVRHAAASVLVVR